MFEDRRLHSFEKHVFLTTPCRHSFFGVTCLVREERQIQIFPYREHDMVHFSKKLKLLQNIKHSHMIFDGLILYFGIWLLFEIAPPGYLHSWTNHFEGISKRISVNEIQCGGVGCRWTQFIFVKLVYYTSAVCGNQECDFSILWRVRVAHSLQHTAPYCNTLQHTAPHCNTLHHTATHLTIL